VEFRSLKIATVFVGRVRLVLSGSSTACCDYVAVLKPTLIRCRGACCGPRWRRRCFFAGLAWRAWLLRAMADQSRDGERDRRGRPDRDSALARLGWGELPGAASMAAVVRGVAGGRRVPGAERDHPARRSRRPLRSAADAGTGRSVGVFSAVTSPLRSVAGGDTASAIAAGCPVRVKAHSGHAVPVRIGVLRGGVVAGRPRRWRCRRMFIACHPLPGWRHPTGAASGDSGGRFTGSVGGGLALYDLAVGGLVQIPFYGNWAASNPFFVVTARPPPLSGPGDRDRPAGSFTLGIGQFCTQTGWWFVPSASTAGALVDGAAAASRDYRAARCSPRASGNIFLSCAADGPRCPWVRVCVVGRWAHRAAGPGGLRVGAG